MQFALDSPTERNGARPLRAMRTRFSLAFGSRPLHAVAIIRAAGGVVDIALAATSDANEE
jgi:hypothetical protein